MQLGISRRGRKGGSGGQKVEECIFGSSGSNFASGSSTNLNKHLLLLI
jgi:hypothetical protein